MKFAKVVAQDPATCRVRVEQLDRDGLTSHWIHVMSMGTGKDRAYALPDIGEHVAVAFDEHGEDGVVLGSIYSGPEPPPITDPEERHIAFGDGTVLRYNRASHELEINVIPAGSIKLKVGPTEITLDQHAISLLAKRLSGRRAS